MYLERRHLETLPLPIVVTFSVKSLTKAAVFLNTREQKGMFVINICAVPDFLEAH